MTWEGRIKSLSDRKDRLVEAFLYERAVDRETYQRQLDKLNEAIALAEMELQDARIEELDVEAVLGFAEFVLLNSGWLWIESSLEQKPSAGSLP